MNRDFAPSAPIDHHRQVSGRIYSVGYEGLEVRGLVETLKGARVTLLVDVRLNPTSRRPGWSKKSLQAALEGAGIAYRHEKTLGNPPENRESFRTGDPDVGRRRMREILDNGAGSALRRVVNDAKHQRIAVLCVERSEGQCHRKVITDMATEIDPSIEVVPIL
jgi:uncharacterized protein (DUF488 family)